MLGRSLSQLPRWQLTASLGLGALLALSACGATRSDADGGEGGVTTDPGGDDSSDEGEASGSSSSTGPEPSTTGPGPEPGDSSTTEPEPEDSSTTDPEPETDSGPKFDLFAPDFEIDDCEVIETNSSALEAYPECRIEVGDASLYWGCVMPESDESCEELCPGGDCIADWTNCMGDMLAEPPSELCGPYEIDGVCCTLGKLMAVWGE